MRDLGTEASGSDPWLEGKGRTPSPLVLGCSKGRVRGWDSHCMKINQSALSPEPREAGDRQVHWLGRLLRKAGQGLEGLPKWIGVATSYGIRQR